MLALRVGLLVAAAGCQAQPGGPTTEPLPTPFPEIATTPSFQGWVVRRVLDFRQQAPNALPLGFGVRVEAYPHALEQVEGNSFELLVSSTEPPANWFVTPLGWEAVVFAVHPENRVRRLEREQLLAIFTGQIWNWSDVGGADLEIEPLIPLAGDELREYLARSLMEGHPFSSGALLGPTPELTVPMVADRPGAIAVLPLTAVDGQVRPLLVDGVAPRPESVASGEYDLRVEVLAYAPDEPGGQVREWLVWLQSGP